MLTLSIAAVERDTGLSKDTLRVWERRYGFPNPARDGGERAYPLDQVERLRLVKRLLDAGHRPGRVVALPLTDLQQLAGEIAADGRADAVPAWDDGVLDESLALLREHDLPAFRRQLARDLGRVGLPRFVFELLLPLTRAVGDAWLRGQMQVFEERACTEVLLALLRGAVAAMPAPEPLAGPRVLVATLPGEPQALPPLVVEALLATDGAVCVPLGPQVPAWDIASAAEAYRADIVVVAGAVAPGPGLDALADLRAKLPPAAELWTLGIVSAAPRRRVDGVRALDAMAALLPAVADWRQRQH